MRRTKSWRFPWRQNHGTRLQLGIWLAAVFVHWSKNENRGAARLFDRIVTHPDAISVPIFKAVEQWQRQTENGVPVAAVPYDHLQLLAQWGREG